MFYQFMIFWFLVQAGAIDPTPCYPDSQQVYLSDGTEVRAWGYTCPIQPVRSRHR